MVTGVEQVFVNPPVTAVRHVAVHDPGLPMAAVGVLVWLLSLRDDLPIALEGLQARGLSGDEVQAAIGVLEARGYLWRFEDRGSDAVVDIVVDDPLVESVALFEAAQLSGVWMSELRRVLISDEIGGLS